MRACVNELLIANAGDIRPENTTQTIVILSTFFSSYSSLSCHPSSPQAVLVVIAAVVV